MIHKIALVRPGKYPEGLIIPLGLAYLAGYIRKKLPDIELIIIDAPLEDLDGVAVAERVKASGADLVGLTGLTVHLPYVKEAAREIRKVCPGTPIVVGGAGVSSDPFDVLKDSSIDFGILGEGEEVFHQFIRSLSEGRDPSTIRGLVYKNCEGKIIKNEEQDLIENPDDIPFPAYDLIPIDRFFFGSFRNSQSPVYISKKILPVLTSRGCPFKCVFCHDTLGKTFRHRSPDNIVQEIIWLKKTYDFEELEIVDDIFNFNIRHAKSVFKKLIEANLGLKIAFPNGIKYEMIDDELMGLFKTAGVYRLAFGIESGSPEGQKLVRKITKLGRMREIIDQADRMGFFVSGFFQLGLPGETKEQMQETIDFAVSTKLHTAMFHVTTPFPGTPMFEEHVRSVIESGEFTGSRELYEEELRKKVSYKGGARDISMNLSAVSNEELLSLKRQAFFRFYFSPRRIISLFRVTPVKKRLFKNFLNVLSEILFRRWLVQS